MEHHFNTELYKSLDIYLSSQGVEHLLALPYTPQKISLAECQHRHIVEMTRTLHYEASLHRPFCSSRVKMQLIS